jgi:replication-associated recombination protein RarA
MSFKLRSELLCYSFPRTLRTNRDTLITTSRSCQLTEDGRQALLKLSRGDMRRALNVLQVRFILPSIAHTLMETDDRTSFLL